MENNLQRLLGAAHNIAVLYSTRTEASAISRYLNNTYYAQADLLSRGKKYLIEAVKTDFWVRSDGKNHDSIYDSKSIPMFGLFYEISERLGHDLEYNGFKDSFTSNEKQALITEIEKLYQMVVDSHNENINEKFKDVEEYSRFIVSEMAKLGLTEEQAKLFMQILDGNKI